MRNFVALYRLPTHRQSDPPLGFNCRAHNSDHAEAQCEESVPHCEVVLVSEGPSVSLALQMFWHRVPQPVILRIRRTRTKVNS